VGILGNGNDNEGIVSQSDARSSQRG